MMAQAYRGMKYETSDTFKSFYLNLCHRLGDYGRKQLFIGF